LWHNRALHIASRGKNDVVLNAELAIEVFELRNIQFKDVVARQNCMETANIINVIVIVMTDEKRRRKSQIKKVHD